MGFVFGQANTHMLFVGRQCNRSIHTHTQTKRERERETERGYIGVNQSATLSIAHAWKQYAHISSLMATVV